MTELPKRYDAQTEEPALQEFWKEKQVSAFPEGDGDVFSIDTPPPTLSGRMHLGHAFSYAQGDFIARFWRMNQKRVLYPFGTDDNGLPTERMIEKQQNIRVKDFSPADFRALVLKAVKQQQPEFMGDWERLGISADLGGAYSTIDEHCQKTSQLSFLDLFEKNLVERKETPVSWCPRCQTAIAQAEFENVELSSHMNTVRFSDEDGKELLIMTTRPELIPACVGMAFHPDDKRYQHLLGQFAIVPITGHKVPVFADSSVAQDKGTGLMMVCTFGDKEDVEKWHRHNLDLRVIFTRDGRVSDDVAQYAGLKIKEARKQIIADLTEQDLLVKQEQITHPVNVHERCSTEIEYLKTPQWYVKVLEHKERLLQAGEEINWYPQFMHKRYQHWVENLGWDWCVSRQRPYGVPFPVWYTKDGAVVVASKDELPIDPLTQVPAAWKGREDELTAETDVMDTWATSSVTPQIALDWASGKPFTQMTLRLQAHDIIRTWAFYTIVKSVFHHDTVPWRDIVISGHALDPKGKKMSKSKGNVVDPNEVISKYSADSIRYWAASTKLGEDLPYQEKDVVTGQKTLNKLWNASKFCFMHLDRYDGSEPKSLELMDRWVLAKYSEMVLVATEAFEQYEYSRAKAAVDQFFWGTFCDYYLEFVKDRLYNDERDDASALYTLHTVLLGTLKVFAPIMPHITEKLYQAGFAEKEDCVSIHVSTWPKPIESVDADAAVAGDVLSELLGMVRKFKSERELSLKIEFPSASINAPVSIDEGLVDFKSTARIHDVKVSSGDTNITIETTDE